MDNIKIGSIVRCNAQALTCYGLNGLVYKLNHYAIATVAFSGEKQTRVIPVDLLTLVGEIEPGCMAFDDVAKYCQNDISITKQAAKVLLNLIYGIHSKTLKEEIQMKTKSRSACNPIKKVIFNDPATIVFWKDGTKTIVKCQEGATFDPEKGLAMAISRHYLCDICGLERYDGIFKRYMPKEEKK